MKSRQRNTVKARKGDRLGQRKRETPAESVMIKRETEVRREGKRGVELNIFLAPHGRLEGVS